MPLRSRVHLINPSDHSFGIAVITPRWLYVLPNGDVLVAESTQVAGPARSVFSYAMQATMRRAAALGVSANRITLLRDSDGDGVAEGRGIFMEGLNQPFGMALLGDTFYVGNTDGVVAFPYAAGADRITVPGRKLVDFKPAGHWTRSLLASPDGRKLYAGVGSLSNIGDNGMEAEKGRAHQALGPRHSCRPGRRVCRPSQRSLQGQHPLRPTRGTPARG